MGSNPQQLTPDRYAYNFYKSFMSNQFALCWTLFTKKTQQHFLEWTLNDVYKRHPQAAQAAKLGIPEIKLMFERNDPSLMKSFWKRFYYSSSAYDIYRYGYYETVGIEGKTATIRITLHLPDGRKPAVDVQFMKEGNTWKFAYVESKLPF
ncbi:MAG: hypothetical protein SFZ03_11635 [Candidatus Melainabacteria bacterium]|nr:hypothetical protein [Candidatus Melainabacteria bacterium]